MNCFIHVGIRKAELCRIATGEPGEEAHNIFGAQRMKILMRLDPESRRPERSEGEQSNYLLCVRDSKTLSISCGGARCERCTAPVRREIPGVPKERAKRANEVRSE